MSVALAYVHDKDVTHSFHDSLTNMVLWDAGGPQHFFGVVNPLKMRCSLSVEALVGARNKVAQQVVDGSYDWLFWIDTDMGFEPDIVHRLVSAADPTTRPIVGGLCFANREGDADGFSGFETHAVPTILDWSETRTPRGYVNRAWYLPNALTECDATGSACLLIHRSVLERIRDECGPVWYDQELGDQGLISEDISFCRRAKAAGYPIFVLASARTTHMKTTWLSDRLFWEQADAPPASDRVAVLVPVMRRPQNAEPFMRSLRASTGLADAYAIYDEDDLGTRDAWKQAGAHVIQSSGPTFAVKINDGYRATSEPWMFLVGDDVRFHPGWYDHARLAGEITDAAVVGTNDLCNPRVVRGEHATHMLVRRSYVAETGFWDGPGVVCHEGYGHWFVDDELVMSAKQAGVWSMSLASRVEHLHPIFGKGENDAVYELGQSRQEQDAKIFEARASKHGGR